MKNYDSLTEKEYENLPQSEKVLAAMQALAKDTGVSYESIFEGIENSIMTACKNNFEKTDNITVNVDRETGEITVYATKTVVEDVTDECLEISLDDALAIDKNAVVGDSINDPIDPKTFTRIAAQNGKNVVLQKIREEERNVVFNEFAAKRDTVVTGTVSRIAGKNIIVNLDHVDASLSENEQVKGEHFRVDERIKVYVLEVNKTNKGPRVLVSRTHPNLVLRLFAEEVTEIKDGTVEIMSIAREAGSRTKMAVKTNNPAVDPVGACVGINGARVNAIVDELGGEKIDIVNWDENAGNYIQNALSPAQCVAVFADPDEKTAKVVVPDFQLSLAIGKEGQNARLAAKLTGYKIDIKSETQAKDAEGFRYEDYMMDDEDEYEYSENAVFDEDGNYLGEAQYDENGNYIGVAVYEDDVTDEE